VASASGGAKPDPPDVLAAILGAPAFRSCPDRLTAACFLTRDTALWTPFDFSHSDSLSVQRHRLSFAPVILG